MQSNVSFCAPNELASTTFSAVEDCAVEDNDDSVEDDGESVEEDNGELVEDDGHTVEDDGESVEEDNGESVEDDGHTVEDDGESVEEDNAESVEDDGHTVELNCDISSVTGGGMSGIEVGLLHSGAKADFANVSFSRLHRTSTHRKSNDARISVTT